MFSVSEMEGNLIGVSELIKQSSCYEDAGWGICKENLRAWIQRKEEVCRDIKRNKLYERKRKRIQQFQELVAKIQSGFANWARKQSEEHVFTYLLFRRKKESIGICSNCGQPI